MKPNTFDVWLYEGTHSARLKMWGPNGFYNKSEMPASRRILIVGYNVKLRLDADQPDMLTM